MGRKGGCVLQNSGDEAKYEGTLYSLHCAKISTKTTAYLTQGIEITAKKLGE